MEAGVARVGRQELGSCPAAVIVGADGDTLFTINRDVFPTLPRGEQYFILAHELGHRLLGSGRLVEVGVVGILVFRVLAVADDLPSPPFSRAISRFPFLQRRSSRNSCIRAGSFISMR